MTAWIVPGVLALTAAVVCGVMYWRSRPVKEPPKESPVDQQDAVIYHAGALLKIASQKSQKQVDGTIAVLQDYFQVKSDGPKSGDVTR